MGDERWEVGGGRWEVGGGRWEMGGEFSKKPPSKLEGGAYYLNFPSPNWRVGKVIG